MSDVIVVADDHPAMRSALRLAVEQAFPDIPVVETGSLAGTQTALESYDAVRLLLLDLSLSDSDGLAGLLLMRNAYPALPVVIVSASEGRSLVARALAMGASGFIPKSAAMPLIVEALGQVAAGHVWAPDDAAELSAMPGSGDPGAQAADGQPGADVHARLASLTPAQIRVLTGMTRGLLNKQIAWELGITEATVKAHVTAILRKLEVGNRTQAVLLAQAVFGTDSAPSPVHHDGAASP